MLLFVGVGREGLGGGYRILDKLVWLVLVLMLVLVLVAGLQAGKCRDVF